MIVLGLTGSIGMGKSTTAKMFAEAGAAVYDADAAVHRLYSGRAVAPVEQAFPGVSKNGVIDRAALGKIVLSDKAAMAQLEAIVHPLVHEEELAFLQRAREERRRVAVLDIPLLLEKWVPDRVRAVCVVSASAEVQRQRVLDRPGMSEEKFQSILAKQMPDADKRKRAHFIVDSGRGLETARFDVSKVMNTLAYMA
ncbi:MULTISPECIES: dephospho-CoA kinase [Pseudovibrio]|uniref:dephospho-CoA kinase n=1 Tax=Stappiaceae TaxID=2821832 RepID=UPI002366B480|nr:MULTISPECIES: dephospho-CoA kinase [Pseudovibrio]MDD7909531.1 dephospho-CoA kinase [Pseudovibrio exalbescens]MDX5595116.1 dephospho-CoA kinase [Pseudovibrio sp. SPO723]